jgi:hypothetical protein
MRPFFRKSFSPLILALALLPLAVGFEVPDSAGTYAKVSGGHGAYHLTGCHRDFDSDFSEGEVAMRHSFATASKDPSPGFLKRLQPELTTVGYHADFVTQELTIVRADTAQTKSRVGDRESARGFAGGGYVGLDWKWVGLDLGVNALILNLGVDDAEKNKAAPMLGLRVGLRDGIYATGEVNGSNPFLTGGGQANAGLGMKLNDTRAWVGVGSYGFNGMEPLGVIKVDQGFGPWGVSLTAQGSAKDVPPSGLGIDHEYGFSLGVMYRLSSLDAGK